MRTPGRRRHLALCALGGWAVFLLIAAVNGGLWPPLGFTWAGHIGGWMGLTLPGAVLGWLLGLVTGPKPGGSKFDPPPKPGRERDGR